MKKILHITSSIAFCLLLALTLGCKEKELPGSIHGSITDKATGEPIKSAGVELLPIGQKTLTGSDGEYSFPEVDPGTYKLHITKTGYEELVSNEIVVSSSKPTPCVVQLEKLPPSLRIVNDKTEDIDSLDFGANQDDKSRSFNIFNDGIESLEWEITKTAEWITGISKESGEIKAGKTQTIILTIDREKLKGGYNVTTVHITSNDGSKQLRVIATGENMSLPTLNTLAATDVKRTSAIFHGELLNEGEPAYHERGFVYSLSSMPTVETSISKLTVAITGDKTFQATATNLTADQTYYIRAYAINKAGTAYSTNEVKCQPSKVLPQVKTEAITHKSIAEGRATLNATIVDAGDPVYTERGFVYGTSHNPMLDDADVIKKAVSGQGSGVYSVNLTDMEMGTVYYVRAYAINEVGTAYGEEVVMDFNIERPIIITKAVEDITATTATLYAEIQSIGDPAYTEAGFIYGTMPNPTIDEEGVILETVKGTGIGSYKKEIENLVVGTTYYVRAFLRNEHYTAYGDIKSFKADDPLCIIIPEYNLMIQKSDLGTGTYSFDNASALCNGSIVSGYTDWRLPTYDELMIMYNNKDLIGGFKGDYYLSQTCCSGISYYAVNFNTGRSTNITDGYVRAVRTITE